MKSLITHNLTLFFQLCACDKAGDFKLEVALWPYYKMKTIPEFLV